MTQLLSQLSESIAQLVATAAPILTAIRIGPDRHVTGFIWRHDLIVTSDQILPAAADYTVVLSTGALILAQPGPRDPGHDLAALRPGVPVPAATFAPAAAAAVGALTLVLGCQLDGSPTVRLTAVHSVRRAAAAAPIQLDLAAGQVGRGGPVLDASGSLLGMASVAADGEAVVVPHDVIVDFVAAATAVARQTPPAANGVPPIPAVSPIDSGNAGRQRGWLGVSLQPITVPDNLAHRAGQRTARQVVGITRGGPADRAGLRSGDVLLALNGATTSGNHALRACLGPERIGSTVEVRLLRDGLIHTTILTIAAPPES